MNQEEKNTDKMFYGLLVFFTTAAGVFGWFINNIK
jgi:hypothetical protein